MPEEVRGSDLALNEVLFLEQIQKAFDTPLSQFAQNNTLPALGNIRDPFQLDLLNNALRPINEDYINQGFFARIIKTHITNSQTTEGLSYLKASYFTYVHSLQLIHDRKEALSSEAIGILNMIFWFNLNSMSSRARIFHPGASEVYMKYTKEYRGGNAKPIRRIENTLWVVTASDALQIASSAVVPEGYHKAKEAQDTEARSVMQQKLQELDAAAKKTQKLQEMAEQLKPGSSIKKSEAHRGSVAHSSSSTSSAVAGGGASASAAHGGRRL